MKLTVTHTMDKKDSKLMKEVSNGWPHILASLKSLLETGEPLEGTDQLAGRDCSCSHYLGHAASLELSAADDDLAVPAMRTIVPRKRAPASRARLPLPVTLHLKARRGSLLACPCRIGQPDRAMEPELPCARQTDERRTLRFLLRRNVAASRFVGCGWRRS